MNEHTGSKELFIEPLPVVSHDDVRLLYDFPGFAAYLRIIIHGSFPARRFIPSRYAARALIPFPLISKTDD